MRAVTGWGHMMTQTVTIAPWTGQDSAGDPTFGTAVSYRCRLVGKRRLVLNDLGQQVLSRQTLYLMSADGIAPQSKVTLSTGDVGSTESWAINPPIVSTARYPANDGGFHSSVVYLG